MCFGGSKAFCDLLVFKNVCFEVDCHNQEFLAFFENSLSNRIVQIHAIAL